MRSTRDACVIRSFSLSQWFLVSCPLILSRQHVQTHCPELLLTAKEIAKKRPPSLSSDLVFSSSSIPWQPSTENTEQRDRDFFSLKKPMETSVKKKPPDSWQISVSTQTFNLGKVSFILPISKPLPSTSPSEKHEDAFSLLRRVEAYFLNVSNSIRWQKLTRARPFTAERPVCILCAPG